MYIPQPFEETRLEVLHELMRSRPFGTLVIQTDQGLVANHLPFLIASQAGEPGTLRGHVARSNPIWRQLGSAPEALAIFQGPHSYVTPSWYPSKQADGKVVPTWNYAVVHAYGRPRAIEDAVWLLDLVRTLTQIHESGQERPWSVSDAPKDYIDRMIGSIVGIEMPLSRLEGKWKVSQNRPVADRLGVAAGLEERGTEESRAMAALVLERVRPSQA